MKISMLYRLLIIGAVFLCSNAPLNAQISDSLAREIARQMDEEIARALADSLAAAQEADVALQDSTAQDSLALEEEFQFAHPYGNNFEVGKYIKVNGIGMYYEVYGKGKPMLLIHGNGGDILSMGYQIEHFAKTHQVIVADSRGHGNSELGTNNLNYVQMAEDWAELVDRLQLDSVDILGWSDGGIIGLLMAIKHPEKVRRLAVMGANLKPDKSAVYPWAVNWVGKLNTFLEQKIAEDDTSKDWFLIKQQMDLLRTQPNIPVEDLKKITAPVLVMAGDNDIIREEHTVLIYQNIPNAHLCIFPGQTHFIPATDPELFNLMVERFFDQPFTRPTSKELMFKN